MEQQANAPPEARAIANFLRNSSLVPLRNGILGGTRHSYFHGTRAVAALQSPAYQKMAAKHKPPLPVPTDDEEAEKILHQIIPFAFFLRVERGNQVGSQKRPDGGTTERLRELKVVQSQMFKKELHYAWFYEGSQLRLQLMGLGMVALLLAGVMFPLWPPIMRQGVWYLSIGLLGLVGAFFVLAIIRLILWGLTTLVGKGWWLFPNLFADVGFVDSFIPVWEWDVPPPPKKSKKAKGGAVTSSQGDALAPEAPALESKAAVNGDKAPSSESAQAGSGNARSGGGQSGTSTPATKDKAKEPVKKESDNLAELD